MISGKKHQIGFSIIVLYIVLIYLINIASFISAWFFPDQNLWWLSSANKRYFFTSGAYICVALLIWIEWANINEYHLDRNSLMIFALLGPLWRVKGENPLESVYVVIILFASIIIYIVFWVIVIGLVIEGFQPIIFSQISRYIPSDKPLADIVRNFISGLAPIVAVEEFIFRGYLWGYLQKFGWTERKSSFTQAVLFWGGHFSTIIQTPLSFFITIPMGTWVFSGIVREKKQIFWSIMVHSLLNAVIPVVVATFL